MSADRGRVVYSTGPDGAAANHTAACRRCGDEPCRCEPGQSRPPEGHVLRVRRERSGRKGKTVTVAGPFHLTRDDAMRLLKRIKKHCGSGGTLRTQRDVVDEPWLDLEVQGDHADALVMELTALGFPAKRAGG